MGMTIDTAITVLGMVEAHGICIEAKDIAVETMRKYQHITEIVEAWKADTDLDSYDCMADIEGVLNGNDDYEARLKADLKAILVELQMEIREHDPGCGWEGYADKNVIDCIIQQKINELKAEREG